ncbi:MAG: methylmalonyl Co-A mutase-associated GTPase MeaB [Bdellovibrionales bacterium]|nr:methylmalonyl Co-A mutase-associated GTPase MeaB [Bdellovibrionales bacterium]
MTPEKKAAPPSVPTWKDRAELARLLSRLESRPENLPELVGALAAKAGHARIIGFTGPPGAGKSTLVNALVTQLRKGGKTVAAFAVDPSSPFTGGAVLGDRVRMQEHALDPGVFIRSAGTRGRSGGLSRSTRECVLALDAAGFDVVLVESAGVGQTEWDIRRMVQTTVVVLVPESGDGIQLMKAGLMEIADAFVVNKGDRPGADRMETDLRAWVHGSAGGWELPVVKTQATSGLGMPELWSALEAHAEFLTKSGEGARRREEGLRREVGEILSEAFGRRLEKLWESPEGQKLAGKLRGGLNPYAVAQELEGLFSNT